MGQMWASPTHYQYLKFNVKIQGVKLHELGEGIWNSVKISAGEFGGYRQEYYHVHVY